MRVRSVHDNRVLRYEVDSNERRIVIHTAYDDVAPAELTDVVFEGVIAYQFGGDDFATILFGIEEIDLGHLVRENESLFIAGRNYSWPGPWNTSIEAAVQHLNAVDAKACKISSSCGLDGWVVADSWRVVACDQAGSV